MVEVFYRHANGLDLLTETLRGFLQGRATPPALVTFDPAYRPLSSDEAREVIDKGTLGGHPVQLGNLVPNAAWDRTATYISDSSLLDIYNAIGGLLESDPDERSDPRTMAWAERLERELTARGLPFERVQF